MRFLLPIYAHHSITILPTIRAPFCTQFVHHSAHHSAHHTHTNMHTIRTPICTPILPYHYPSYYDISVSFGDCCSFFFIFHFLIKGRKHNLAQSLVRVMAITIQFSSFFTYSPTIRAPFSHHSCTIRPPFYHNSHTIHPPVLTPAYTLITLSLHHHTILSLIHSESVVHSFLSFISLSKEEHFRY